MLQKIIWIGLYVQDMSSSIGFYRDVLGLKLLRSGADWADFDAGQGVLLELLSGGLAAGQPKSPAQQPLVVGFQVADLDQAMSELRERGVNFVGEVQKMRNQRWAHFTDPEGNQLEIKEIR